MKKKNNNILVWPMDIKRGLPNNNIILSIQSSNNKYNNVKQTTI